uniref:Probable transport protein n=1 Tax=Marsupiomonas sp. NIES 1824 TaxID=1562198 RepID=A0A097KLS8_9CHLO|nr:probable transport protein [Marsupiomonas sp. NIES 1824]
MSILIENISKTFHKNLVLNHVNLEIQSGSLVALVGPSGSGKSTLLRIIAGLEKPNHGRIWLFGRNANQLPIQNREVGFVFQNYALFEHLTVAENIAFGLSLRDVDQASIKKRIRELTQLVQLEGFQNRYPRQLSGGQRQRVALARALAIEPKLLLLDEPFGALDEKVKKELCSWLKDLHEKVPVTTIFVTHDQQEALEIATDIVIFKNGKVEQMGTPQEIYDFPMNSFIRHFMGKTNHFQIGKKKLELRPHEFEIHEKPATDHFPFTIHQIIYGEPLIQLFGMVENQDIQLQISRQKFLKISLTKTKNRLYIRPRVNSLSAPVVPNNKK